MLGKKKSPPKWHSCKESAETYFCHIFSSYKHFNKNDDMFVNFFPALTARIRVKMHLCNMDKIDYL
jgi:hypothetical protein